jgi:kynurenine formamidase
VTAPVDSKPSFGALAQIDDAKRLEALSLVRAGRVYDLSHELHEGIPVFPGRSFHQTLVTTAHHANGGGVGVGANEVNWITEVYSSTSQLGTHLDSLAHLQRGMHGYGGISVDELAGVSGVNHLGAETIPQVVTRGWLVDVAPMRPGEVIGIEPVDGIDPAPGDAVFFHTGWGRHWDDPESYLVGQPGPGLALADWLVRRGVALTGCDTWSYGPVPAEDPARPFEVPQTLNVDHGVLIVENLDLSQLATDRVHEFCLVVTHPKLRGASGAWTAPIALV